MDILRTPDDRFVDLPDFPFDPHYVEDLPGYEGLRMHYIDEGPRDGELFVCLHGEPSWSFLYRKMARVFLDRGHRVVCPDWFGFGRSDKPVDDDVYTWDFHHGSMLRFIEHLGPQPFTLVVQDWGGLLGLTLPMVMPDLVKRLIVMNTALATGDVNPGPGFVAWREFVASQPDLNVGNLMQRAINGLTEDEARAYDAPFPDARYKAGVRRFPPMVPTSPDDPGAEMSRRARSHLSQVWSGESFLAVGLQDPVLGPPAIAMLQKIIAGAPAPLEVPEGGHFVQEHGEQIALAACEAFGL